MHSPKGIFTLKRGTHPLIPSREGSSETQPQPLFLEKSNETHPRPLLLEGRNETHPLPLLLEGRTGVAMKEDVSPLPLRERDRVRGISLKEELVGAKVKAIQGEDPSVTKVSYFKGNDPSKWKTNISTYDAVNLGEVYKGISLKLRAYGNNVEKLFCVKPGADPEQIKIRLSGLKDCGVQHAEITHPLVPSREGKNPKSKTCGERGRTIQNPKLQINNAGELVAETELGPVKFTKPVAYQEIDGKKQGVAVEYMVAACEVRSILLYQEGQGVCEALNTNPLPDIHNCSLTYGFKVASYDKTKDLIIDPLLASTFLGGRDYDYGYSLALDTSGNVYVTGYTQSNDFPTTSGGYDTSFNGNSDVFVSKLDGGLTTLMASTCLGGSNEDDCNSLTLDTNGNVYVTGHTFSSDFPTTGGAYDNSYNNFVDVFVAKLNEGLTSLLASTYMGGPYYDEGNSLSLDASGNVYVTGYTVSTNFPTTSGAYDTSHNGGYDVFVSKLDSGLRSLLASTYLGGSSDDYVFSNTLDTIGNVYVTGYTQSSAFPTTSGAYDTSWNGGSIDIFVSKLDGGLTSLLASTFLGGSDDDSGYSLALDTSGNVYVTGYTQSIGFPTTNGAYDTSFNSDRDVFVSKLNSGLTSLLASTYLGGHNYELGYSLALDTSGDVYVAGWTDSTSFPTSAGAYDTVHNGGYDVFVSKLNGGLTNLLASTFLGGFLAGDNQYDADLGYSLTLDTNGNVYVTGYTQSSAFPTTSGAYDTSFNNSSSYADVFVSKLDSDLSAKDTIAPTGLISINSGAEYTNTTYVTLNLSATDELGVTGYYVSTNFLKPSPSDSGWTDITTTTIYSGDVPYTLSGGNGTKTVYAWYKDAAGNVSSTANDSIILVICDEATDIAAEPDLLILRVNMRSTVIVTVTGENDCPVEGDTVRTKVYNPEIAEVSPRMLVTDKNGEAVFTIKATDKAGNAVVIFRDGSLNTQVPVKVVK